MAVVDGKIKCSVCQEWKSLEWYQPSISAKGCGTCRPCKYAQKRAYERANPEKYNEQVRKNRAKRREAIRSRSREWLASNKERAKGYGLRRYGITLEQFNAMFEAQGSKCAICSTTDNGVGRSFYVDHCHHSGRVRGILCHKCNSGLGAFRDDAQIVGKALEYLSGR